MRWWIALWAGSTALAADVSAGVELGVVADLGDKVSGEYAQFGLGPSLRVPVFVAMGEAARLRIVGRVESGFGSDRVSWGQYIDGAEVRFYDDEHWAMSLSAGAAIGLDARVPGDDLPVTPYLGGELGVAWFGTYHSFGESTQLLLDPDQNDLDNPSNVDPYTTQAAFTTGLHVGAERNVSDALAVHVEMGYSVAFLKAVELRKSPAELAARREAYGWNPLRVGVGLVAAF